MDQESVKGFQDKLEEKKKTVLEQLDSIGTPVDGAEANFNADFPDYGSSPEDNAIEVADYTTNLSLEKELEEDLQNVEKALLKIKNGTYGVCDHCGRPIETERLNVRPESVMCLACQNGKKK